MVTALDQVTDRVRGLESGADDFLTKPANDLQLMTRVKSLVRLKSLTDELRLRASTTRSIGIEELLSRRASVDESLPKALLVDDKDSSVERISRMLRHRCVLESTADPQAAFITAAEGDFDCVLISTNLTNYDPLRICSQLRTLDRTRFTPIMLIADQGEDARLVRGLELGVNDYLVRPLDQHELIARMVTQVRRKRYNDHLRASLAETIEMAVTDPLTGLNNRRYLDTHLQTLFDRAQSRGTPLSLMIADIDRFKMINDRWGHDAGDAVLRELASRIRRNLRGIDLVCRFGGEEFVVVMPETPGDIAEKVAERIRSEIAATPFEIPGHGGNQVTVSLGVATLRDGADTVPTMIKRADQALYQAKNSGRNRVVAAAA